jgi:hypothetical protein
MGDEYNKLGDVCESRKTSQREEIHMGQDNNSRFLCMSSKVASREEKR